MNILFLSTISFEKVMRNRIYKDLLKQFQDDGHHVYIIGPFEKTLTEYKPLLETGRLTYIPIETSEMKPLEFIEANLNIFRLGRHYLRALKGLGEAIKIDLILYTDKSVLFVNVINYIKKRDNAKTYLLQKEIYSQYAVDAGYMSKVDLRYLYFTRKEKQLYSQSDYIGCLSSANISYVSSRYRHLAPEKLEILPNTITPQDKIINETDKYRLRQQYDLPIDKVIFTYVGQLNKAKGIDFLMQAIVMNEALNDRYIVVTGSGNEIVKLEHFFNEHKPQNAKLLTNLSQEEYERLLFVSDVGIVAIDAQARNPIVPTSLLLYMQASLPIIAAINENSDIHNILTRAQCGFSCQSDQIQRFNALADLMCIKEYRQQLGQNGRKYLENYLSPTISYHIIMSHFQPALTTTY